ncbi:hypothetical protein C7T94_13735 [Pedobacter yulinensis]|uniref:Uncharacterized protein n=1 Tax=Pedobacter yulinensis TaxID=2126353 RepID=A0A2T3HMB2_9SPHI|nr:hypothetical protein [Pedobacter yulinensis]PST83598.1 hypothetical protein C7T94_13735 [Pedobacter yulinensis]
MKKVKPIKDDTGAQHVDAAAQNVHNFVSEETDEQSLEDINGRHRNEIAGADADYKPDLARDGSPFSDEELGPDSPMGKK